MGPSKKDHVFVALSGGKDSAAALHKVVELSKTIGFKVSAIHIYIGVGEWDRIYSVVKEQCRKEDVTLYTVRLDKADLSISDTAKKLERPACAVCGIAKRYIMNRIPRERGATILATGHHSEDFAMFFFKNVLSRNYEWSKKFKPFIKSNHPKVLSKWRPLFFKDSGYTEEVVKKHGLPVTDYECPLGRIDRIKRGRWFETLRIMDDRHPGLLKAMAKYLTTLPDEGDEFSVCENCGEPTNGRLCSFCKTFGKDSYKKVDNAVIIDE